MPTPLELAAGRWAATVWEHLPDPMFVATPDGSVLAANAAARRRLTTDHVSSLLGPLWHHLYVGEIVEWLRGDRVWSGELVLDSGPELEVWAASAVAIYDEHDELTQVVLEAHDVSPLWHRARHLAHVATHDGLTGLPNRASFLDRLRDCLTVHSSTEQLVGVEIIGIDGFSVVNESLGHEVGDQLLAALAHRLRELCRSDDVVARLGGDQFVVLHPDLHEQRMAGILAERTRLALSQAIYLGDRVVPVSVSIGVATTDGTSPEDLLRDADTALAEAKAGGKGRAVVFDTRLHEQVQARLAMEQALRSAIDGNELSLVFQPQYLLSSAKVVGAEALVRWNSATLGPVSPATFVPVAEDTGIILAIGEWVLREACHQAARWHLAEPAAHNLDVHVNLSTRQFQQPDLVEQVQIALSSSGLAAHRLCLEITETAVVDDMAKATETLRQLKSLGIKVALDDFGVGYSSLSYLRRLPVDVLKLDKSFIDPLGESSEDSAVVMAVINLARALGLMVVAEGVESELQRRELRALGCTMAQGYLFSKPVQADVFTRLIMGNVG